MIVTTSQSPTKACLEQARRLQDQLDAKWLDRRQLSVKKLLQLSSDGKVLVTTEEEVRFYDLASSDSSKPFIYHPSMALIKLKRMLKGEKEPLITYSQCEPGDVVLDCTAGLASDSLVFSLAVGEQGKVIALESEPILYTVVSEGLQQYKPNVIEIELAMRRIEMVQMNHLDFLYTLPDRSVDIVYFDPMFRQPLQESSSIKAIRSVANANALSLEAIREAKRVARKCIIMKEHSKSDEFARLGFERCTFVKGNKVGYGTIRI